MSISDTIPTVSVHRGVPIHSMQSAARIADVVKPEIDAVYAMPDMSSLAAYVMDWTKPPEARLFAEARAKAAWQMAAEAREIRPNIDLTKLAAATAGLSSLSWMDPDRIGTLLEPRGGRPPREVDVHPDLARLAEP